MGKPSSKKIKKTINSIALSLSSVQKVAENHGRGRTTNIPTRKLKAAENENPGLHSCSIESTSTKSLEPNSAIHTHLSPDHKHFPIKPKM